MYFNPLNVLGLQFLFLLLKRCLFNYMFIPLRSLVSVMFLKILSISCISAFKNTAAKCNHSRHKLMLSVSFFIVKTSSEVKVLCLKTHCVFWMEITDFVTKYSKDAKRTTQKMEYKWIMQLMMAFYVLKHSCRHILSLFHYVFYVEQQESSLQNRLNPSSTRLIIII